MKTPITEPAPNTTRHKIGDPVLHEADNPVPHMAMAVIGIKPDGVTYRTKYVHPDNDDKTIYTNHYSRLYIPKQHPDIVNRNR